MGRWGRGGGGVGRGKENPHAQHSVGVWRNNGVILLITYANALVGHVTCPVHRFETTHEHDAMGVWWM